jgi:hypothetical protein
MAQSLMDIMGQIRGGYALNDAGKKLEELVRAVRATNKKGSITFTIDVEPDKTDDRVVTMQPTVKVKIPEKGYSPGIFFLSPDGRLTKDDPAQLDLLAERERDGVRTLEAGEQALSRVGRGSGTDG